MELLAQQQGMTLSSLLSRDALIQASLLSYVGEADYLYTAGVCQGWWRARLRRLCWFMPPQLQFRDRNHSTWAYGPQFCRTLIHSAVTSLSRYELVMAGPAKLQPPLEALRYAVGRYGSADVFARHGGSDIECMRGVVAAGSVDRLQQWQHACLDWDQGIYDALMFTAAAAGRVDMLKLVLQWRDARLCSRANLRVFMGYALKPKIHWRSSHTLLRACKKGHIAGVTFLQPAIRRC